ncbi:Pleckstrin, partial [Geodia barretti]
CSGFVLLPTQESVAAGVIPLCGATLTCPSPDSTKKPWLLQIKTHDRKEFMIQAPDERCRTEWSTPIEECIRRLDPTKIGTVESLSRTLTETSLNTLEMQREMVKAMQDPGAGVKLVEFGPKRGRAATKYFTGKDAIEWLISWSFANDRTSGATLATEMLRNGFFHTVNLDPITNSLALSKDGILSRDVMDSEEAKYVFVSMTSTNPNAVFQSDDDSSSDSEDDILATSSRPESLAAETGFDSDGKVLKQGFLLKKGKVLKEWKPRRFVLREKSLYLYFYRGSKSKKHRGAIPLCGLTIYELDNEIREPETDQQLVSEGGSKRQSARNSRNKVNRILLITATGERVVVEATSAEERSAWIGELRVAVASLDITSS